MIQALSLERDPLVGVKVSRYNRRMRQAREAAGLTQGELADQVGLKASQVSGFETFRLVPSMDQMNRIATALGGDAEHIFPDEIRELKRSGRAPAFYLTSEGIRMETPAAETPDALDSAISSRQAVQKLLPLLTERERFVVERRFGLEDGNPHTLAEISAEMSVTAERVRTIEASAIHKMGAAVLVNIWKKIGCPCEKAIELRPMRGGKVSVIHARGAASSAVTVWNVGNLLEWLKTIHRPVPWALVQANTGEWRRFQAELIAAFDEISERVAESNPT